jgi:hypothetical protein
MRSFFRLTLPPLLPVALLVAVALISGWNLQHSPVEYLPDGTIDNGPELGAGAIILLSPIVYFVLLAMHVIVLYIARIKRLRPLPCWLIVIVLSTCALSTWGIHHQPVGSPVFQEVVFAFVLSIVLFAPLGSSSFLLNRALNRNGI